MTGKKIRHPSFYDKAIHDRSTVNYLREMSQRNFPKQKNLREHRNSKNKISVDTKRGKQTVVVVCSPRKNENSCNAAPPAGSYLARRRRSGG
jgi:hypothetical protein